MFGSIGITEILIISALALIFLGPEKFPEVAKMAARFVRDVRGYMQEAQTEITRELRPVKDELKSISKADTEAYFEKLADLADNDEDTEIVPEPDPTDWYEMNDPKNRDKVPKAPEPEGAVPFDPLDRRPDTSEDEPASDVPERLDG